MNKIDKLSIIMSLVALAITMLSLGFNFFILTDIKFPYWMLYLLGGLSLFVMVIYLLLALKIYFKEN